MLKKLAPNLAILLVLTCNGSGLSIECPTPPEQTNKDWDIAVKAAVAKIGPVTGGDLQTQTKNTTQDLLGKLPNADRIYIEQMMFATFCSLLRDNKSMTDSDKIGKFNDYVIGVRNALSLQPTKSKPPSKQSNALPTTKAPIIEHNTARFGVSLGWQLGRYEFVRDSQFPEAQAAAPGIEHDILSLLAQDGYPNPLPGASADELIHNVLLYYSTKDIRKHASILVGIAAMRATLIGASTDPAHNEEIKSLAFSALQDVDSSVIADKQKLFQQLIDKKPTTVVAVIDLLDKMQ